MKRQKEAAKERGNKAEAIFGNEDLLTEILLRVPAKSLVRFKCVSKCWLELISNRQFGYIHTSRNPKSISALYFHLGFSSHDRIEPVSLQDQRSLPTLSFLNSIKMKSTNTIFVIHALNGLMLCSYGWPKNYIVCNLTTQKYIILQRPTHCEDFVNLCSLVYDPKNSPYYKVVLIRDQRFGSYPIDIYSSEKSSWTHVDAPGPSDFFHHHTAFFNAAIHWMGIHNNYYFRFEVDTAKLTVTPMPSEPRIFSGYKIKFFGECGGDLLLIQYSSSYVEGIKILQMDIETCRWILKQRISLRPIKHAFPDERIRFTLLTVLKGSCEGDIIPVLAIQGKVIAYHPRCKTFKVICYTPPDEFLRKYPQNGGAFQYFENLSPV